MNWDNKAIAKAFNSKVLNDLANGDLSYIEKIAREHFQYDSPVSLNSFFDHVFDFLGSEYPNEYFYKNLIAQKILLGRHSLNTATMLSEFRVGANKADCVILNGKSTCYEIKTDYDSLARLDDQLSSYLQLFDEVYVVCSGRYEQAILDIAPLAVGVMTLTEKNTFRVLRKAQTRQANLNRKLVMQALRQPEYRELAESLCRIKIDVPNTMIYDECFSVIQKYGNDYDLNKKFIEILKKTRKNNDRLINNLPESLANAAISYRFSKKEMDRLINYFQDEVKINVLSNTMRENE